MKELGCKWFAIDHSVFYWKNGDKHTIVAVATDNMAITSKQSIDAENFKLNIRKFWDITDHGPIKWFLGFEIKRNRELRTISINQQAHIKLITEKFRLNQSQKSVHPPWKQMLNSPSTSALQWSTRSNAWKSSILQSHWICVVGNSCFKARYCICSWDTVTIPRPAHWEGVKRVISYLSSTKGSWLIFGGKKDILLEEGTISWSSKKQAIIALLSTKAEYIAQTHVAKEAVWLKTFVNGVRGGQEGPLNIMVDNQGAIALAKHKKFYSHMKHINLHYHFIHEAVEDKRIRMEYIPTGDNVADIFTKPLAKPKFVEFTGKLGLAMVKEWRYR